MRALYFNKMQRTDKNNNNITPPKKIRYYRACTDLDALLQRKSRVSLCGHRKEHNAPAQEGSEGPPCIPPCPLCRRRLEESAEDADLRIKRPHRMCPELPPRTSRAYLEWCMSTKACYIPMLEADYKGDAIHFLAVQGRRAFRRLVDHLSLNPAAISYRDSHGNTPLILACGAHEPYSVVNFLLARSRQDLVRAENHEGLTALHFAVLNDQPDIVKLLLKRKARVDAGSRVVRGQKCGLTPLHLALIDHSNSGNSSRCCFRILLDHGADVFVQMVEGTSKGAVLRHECDCGGCWSSDIGLDLVVPPALIHLRKGQAAVGAAFDIAVYLNNYNQARTLHTRFPAIDLNHTDDLGGRPLFHAVENCNAKMIRFLTENGADVNTPVSDTGNGPLHLLLSHSREELEKNLLCAWCLATPTDSVENVLDSLLLNPDLDIHARNAGGATPLYLAATRGHAHACSRLLELGADPRLVGSSGHTLLCAAYKLCPVPERGVVMRALVSTGASPSVLDSGLLSEVCNNLDIDTVRLLHTFHAITYCDSVQSLISLPHARLIPKTSEYAQRKATFLDQLKDLMLSAPSSSEKPAWQQISDTGEAVLLTKSVGTGR